MIAGKAHVDLNDYTILLKLSSASGRDMSGAENNAAFVKIPTSIAIWKKFVTQC